jgi:hypothetical protein
MMPRRRSRTGRGGFYRIAGVLTLVVLSAMLARPAASQHFETDDATLATFGACQLEAWHGRAETRIEPACHLLRNLEITLGFGLEPETRALEEYTLELKTRFLRLSPGRLGLGLVVGVDLHGHEEEGNGRLAGLFAYVPATLSVADDRLLLHANLGWHLERDGHDHGHGHGDENGDHQAVVWAMRGDLYLPRFDDRLVLVGEVFSEDWLRPGYQVGLRFDAVPERLIVDVSWGGHTDPNGPRNGWIVGVGWTPPAFF